MYKRARLIGNSHAFFCAPLPIFFKGANRLAHRMGAMADTLVKSRPTSVELTKDNIQDFMRRIDTVVSDCDGVLWTFTETIRNAREGLESLRMAGKKLLFVTNNSTQMPLGKFESRLGFAVQKSDLVYPAMAIGNHLEKIGFKKTAYVLGVEHFKDCIRQRGIRVIPDRREKNVEFVEEDLAFTLQTLQKTDPDVGAVIVDLDINVNFMEMTRAINYLRRNEDCLFLAGATDEFASFEGGRTIVLGPLPFLRCIEACSGRKAQVWGKPGSMMIKEYLKDIHDLNLKRTVFVGDSLVQDMGVANSCGMMKLLVLTGSTQLKDLETCDPELLPDYIIRSISDFALLLKPMEMPSNRNEEKSETRHGDETGK